MTHNPYTPPAAEVADAAAPPRPPRPREVRAAVWLIGLSIVLGLVTVALEPGLLDMSDIEDAVGRAIVWIAFFAFLALFIGIAACVAYGHRWARIVYAALVVWSLYSAATGEVAQHFARAWYNGALYLLTSLIDAVTLILLFLPPSNAWFGGAWRKGISPAA